MRKLLACSVCGGERVDLTARPPKTYLGPIDDDKDALRHSQQVIEWVGRHQFCEHRQKVEIVVREVAR